MPYYRPAKESISSPSSDISIDVEYPIDDGNIESGVFPVKIGVPPSAVISSTSGSRFDSAPKPILRGIPTVTFRQTQKLPTSFSSDPCNEFKFYVDGYSGERDRIVYTGEELSESLNAEYTGCCYKPAEDPNDPPVFYQEPNLGQKRSLDMRLEAIGYDTYGKPHWASQPNKFYHIDCVNGSELVGPIVRSETFTLTFNKMEPQIRIPVPHMDDDFVITMKNSNGTTVVIDKDTVGTQSISCTYPETITIKLSGSFSKKLFADETWEYYFEKFDPFTGEPKEYTIIPEHLPIELPTTFERTFDEVQELTPEVITHDGTGEYGDLIPNTGTENIVIQSDSITEGDFTTRIATSSIDKELPFNPNDFIDAFRIDQENKSGTGTGSDNVVRDLSQEVPEGSRILRYESDRTPREAGTTLLDSENRGVDDPDYDPSTGSTIRPGHQDVTLHFTVTSSIPPITSSAWTLGAAYTAGSYVTNGGNLYRVEVGGVVGTGPTPPADVGPSGTSFFTDNSGIEYRYIPSNIANLTSYGAGDWTTTLYVMNDERIGLARLQELLDAQPGGRDK